MITDMDVNPGHRQPPQAFTTFRLPGSLLDISLVLVTVAFGLHTMWEAMTATGSFATAPGVLRAGAATAIIYVGYRWARAGLKQWLHNDRTVGPAIERIEP